MNNVEQRLWPFAPRASLICAVALLLGLLVLIALFRVIFNWPSTQSENVVLIGILLVSLLPILLAFLDIIIGRGAVIEAGGVKVDFSQSKEKQTAGITIAANIGVQGRPVTDSDTQQILDTLKQATASDVVIIDLEEGKAWWETRLLVLLAGADRLKTPEIIVFVATDGRKERRFQGWSYAPDLLRYLIGAHTQYEISLQQARAAAKQWQLVEPLSPAIPGAPAPPPATPPWLGPLASRYAWMAFDPSSGLHNKLFAEQVLQSELGQKIESQEGARSISLVRLEELFRPILNRDSIELTWPADRQLSAFLATVSPTIAVTQDGQYSALVSKLTLLNEVLKSFLEGQRRK